MEAGRFGFFSKSSEIVDLGKKIYKILTLENQYQIWMSDCLSGGKLLQMCNKCVAMCSHSARGRPVQQITHIAACSDCSGEAGPGKVGLPAAPLSPWVSAAAPDPGLPPALKRQCCFPKLLFLQELGIWCLTPNTHSPHTGRALSVPTIRTELGSASPLMLSGFA